jgi:hypothetical protein
MPKPTNKTPTRPRKCKVCETPEKIDISLGFAISNLTPYSCLCRKCINTLVLGRPKKGMS